MYREPTVKGRKLGLKSMVWTRSKEQTINQNRMKKQEFKKKNGEKLRNFQENFKCSNISVIGVTEGKEEEPQIETYVKK